MVKLKMKNRKGVSGHIEIILSFTIFLAFIVFVLIYVNPIEKVNKNTHYLDMTETAIMNLISTELTTFSLTLDNPSSIVTGDCFCVNIDDYSPKKLIVKDESGTPTNSQSTAFKKCIRHTGAKLYRLYFSEEFVENPGVCNGAGAGTPDLPLDQFTLGVLNDYKKISNKTLFALDQSYNVNYVSLKANLGLVKSDFNVFVTDMNGNLLVNGKIREPRNVEIMAKENPIEIITQDGDIIPAIMNIQVWE